mmetsp:Transcript_4176/g.5668  ORF Transcript_4176/g.5668 Transcript_4176/m.5668 type:complete len:387 (-) Transcript_4176:354-1514(-)|eukprot:CAMPEP_0185724318 /NCGR_PEP_ID=MMETSP1171-20130828/830_1 /TAXON_ID=374046 /ORGANISM="Helicotheca tamensis, Strain CCMP826" /LENGTH=386 /DNA_ID=CAMNT_0028392137 /DNA_START=40 /DNA_END=1200 /DNA_ORIENTATION=+
MVSSGFGSSTLESTKEAVIEAVKAATSSVSDPSIAFISCTVSRDVDEVLKEFVDALPKDVPIHGITSSGALLSSKGSQGGAVGCLLLKGGEGDFATAYDAEKGETAVLGLKEKMASPQVIFMGATPGAEEGIIASIKEHFPGVPVYGGTAADDALSGDWKVMCRETASGTGVSLVGVGSSVKYGASMLGPYTETEKTVKATKAEGRRVFDIDGKPAADFVYEWLGEDVTESYNDGGLILPQTAQKPVGIKKPSGEYVTNHLAALGGEEKYVDFFAPIPEGAELIIMDSGDGPSTGYADALANAYDTAKKQGSLDGESPAAGILVFCGGMAIAVGENLDKGLTSDAFASKVGDLPMLGMTCFGEQAYLEGEKENVQRNLSVGMILLG